MATATFMAGVISQCNYASEQPGFSDVAIDYPVVQGPDTVFDQVDILMKPWGRDPADNQVLYVNETNVDRWKAAITQNGVNSLSAEITPLSGNPIDASIVRAGLTTAGVVQDIDPDAKYLIWGMWEKGNVGDQEALPPALRPWWIDAAVTVERFDAFNAFMLARGTSQGNLDGFWADHPGGTYRETGQDFERLL